MTSLSRSLKCFVRKSAPAGEISTPASRILSGIGCNRQPR
uniref:Uncharacterized protein n=1 Tax=Parascaris univalens TaxID=6257 RepID=A0A914ZNA6_PARUN